MRIRATSPAEFTFSATDTPDTRAQKLELMRKVLGGTGVGGSVLTYSLWGTNPLYWNVNIAGGLVFTAANGNFLEWEADGVHPRSIWGATPGFAQWWGLGFATANGRYGFDGDVPWEFLTLPYVGTQPLAIGAHRAVTKTAGYTETATSGEVIAFCNQPAGLVIVLPPAAASSAMLTFKKISAGGAIVLTRAGSDTIDGAASLSITTQWNSVTLVSDGVSAWGII